MALNDVLYNRLVQKFGHNAVSIVRPNEPYIPNWKTDLLTGRKYRDSNSNGEAYRLSCPYCGDQKGRLYVNHFWMQWDTEAMRHVDDMIRCFNEENCFSNPDRRSEFFQLLFSGCDAADLQMPIKPSEAVVEEVVAVPPGPVVSLRDLYPEHPARQYLRNRGYDLEALVDWWHVGYCRNRIYIPLFHNGELKGYQCRYVGDREWTADCPKYITMSHFRRSKYLYNIDNASRSRVVVLVEGPMSAWTVGPRAVGLWGKSISSQQVDLLRTRWADNCLIVVMLDGDVPVDSDKMTIKLKANCSTLVVQAKIPGNRDDPSTLGEAACWSLIQAACAKRDILLSDYLIGENHVISHIPQPSQLYAVGHA